MNFGLTDQEVKSSREKYGSNKLESSSNNSFIRLLLESLSDPIIKILLIALAIKIIFLFKDFDWFETIGILIAIFLASFISSLSEYGSNKAFEKLQSVNNNQKCKAYRNNKLSIISFEDIVVGDIIKISSGDRLPSDGIIIKGNLSLDESFLTGETKEINKKTGDKVYGLSVNFNGEALIKITHVGQDSYVGSISRELNIKNDDSPLKQRLTVLAKQISKLGYIGAILTSITYLFVKIIINNNFDLYSIYMTITNISLMSKYLIYCLTVSVTIIIMAVPEGLPMMITLVLSSNMKRMLKDNVLVRKLVGIETSGSINVLLCDKTGTLTEGKLKLNKIITYQNIFNNLNEVNKSKNKNIIKESLILNNESTYENNLVIGGNSTDQAILLFFKEKLNNKVIDHVLFSSEKKFSKITLDNGNTYYKGAWEILLDKCNSFINVNNEIDYNFSKSKIENIIKSYTSKGYRVLLNCQENKDKLVFISILIIEDSLRKETIKSIEGIQNAGVKVVMITGDNQDTAINIAKKCNIYKYGDTVLTHEELSKLDDNSLSKKLDNLTVVARALPIDKGRLVKLYKEKGKVVAMTGDGVNDVIALKKSDVAFALGSGSEVAKEASDIVILDDNINSIYKAILYGRTIFKSIRKFITYQLTVNISALILSSIGILFGVTSPITIIQMLWLNMIMDTFAGLAFSYEIPMDEYMIEKPKEKDEKIINKYMYNQITVNGLSYAIICLLFLKLPCIKLIFNTSKSFMTAFFGLFIFIGIINSFLSRTHYKNIFNNIYKNKVFIFINVFIIITQIFILYKGGDIFRTYGLSIRELLFIIILSFIMIPIDLLRKLYIQKKVKTYF